MQEMKKQRIEPLFTFIQDTKAGKYIEINSNIIETPRIMISRDEYLVDEELPVLFSVANQL